MKYWKSIAYYPRDAPRRDKVVTNEVTIDCRTDQCRRFTVFVMPFHGIVNAYERNRRFELARRGFFSGGGFSGSFTVATVRVKNIAFTKTVDVHYTPDGHNWKDLSLSHSFFAATTISSSGRWMDKWSSSSSDTRRVGRRNTILTSASQAANSHTIV